MNILVLIANVPDTTSKIKFNGDLSEFDASGIQWIINPWDELALTRAMELKEKSGGSIAQVHVASVGTKDIEATLRKALAVGADKAFRIEAEAKDSFSVAKQLTQIAGDYDLILAGIDSADYNGSAVGGILAELLDIESVSAVSGIELNNGTFEYTREIDGGTQTIQIEGKALAIVQKGIAINPRIPAMRGIMMARKKPLEVITSLEVNQMGAHKSFAYPEVKAACKMIDEENAEEVIRLLRNEAKAI
jgi:electron transfer flavoprotein beta subunit